MKKFFLVSANLFLAANIFFAQGTKPFPAHWGKPPEIQTKDYVELPEGYGHGSSTLKKWILANLEKDKGGGTSPSAKGKALFENDFEKAEVGKLPETLEFAVGEFTVKPDGTN